MNPFRRLRRHLSFSNVVACLALFAALGGSAYAAGKINGNKIVRHSIGAGKLKNRTITGRQIKDETITARQIKKGSLDAGVINLSTLPPVQSAQTATSATSAKTATKATTAGSATNAVHADVADNATNATHADTAGTATNATHADSATHADTAGDAETLDGRTAAQLTDTCPAATELFGGMCWDTAPRPAANWFEATSTCGEAGGRLPTISELVAYVLREGEQAPQQVWSGDLAGVEEPSGEEEVLTSDETERETNGPTIKLGYRCLFYRTNAG
ncbi:MAG TPA: hypothetical protein VHA76_06245 [Solirubrobacterales bacterium]|nr:hypothetical protein [Solirubrobacterales bacterium]